MAARKLKFTNGELRNLMYSANTIQSVKAEDVFLAGMPAECGANRERDERTAAMLADAKAIYFRLLELGKYSAKALKGCPGAGMRERWAKEYEEEYLGRVVGDDSLLTCGRCMMMYGADEGDAMLCERCYTIVRGGKAPEPAPVESAPSINQNVQDALRNYLLWLTWHPGDYKGATAIAGDYLDTVQEVDALESELAKLKNLDTDGMRAKFDAMCAAEHERLA